MAENKRQQQEKGFNKGFGVSREGTGCYLIKLRESVALGRVLGIVSPGIPCVVGSQNAARVWEGWDPRVVPPPFYPCWCWRGLGIKIWCLQIMIALVGSCKIGAESCVRFCPSQSQQFFSTLTGCPFSQQKADSFVFNLLP